MLLELGELPAEQVNHPRGLLHQTMELREDRTLFIGPGVGPAAIGPQFQMPAWAKPSISRYRLETGVPMWRASSLKYRRLPGRSRVAAKIPWRADGINPSRSALLRIMR